MVRHMPNQQPLDQVFKALSDPTRRAVLERLTRGPAAMSDLARPFKMALPSFAQHLEMLEHCGLVRSHKRGRVRTFHLEPGHLRKAEDWMTKQRVLWKLRLDQLDHFLTTDQENES